MAFNYGATGRSGGQGRADLLLFAVRPPNPRAALEHRHALRDCPPCIGTKDGSCVAVCPDCIYESSDQYYIDADECIDCGACEPECPVQAIFPDTEVPPEWSSYIEKNRALSEKK